MFTLFKIATAAAVAFVLWTNFADAAELQGPGPFLIINGNNAVVGVVQDGIAIPLEGVGSGAPATALVGTLDNPATTRIQIEPIFSNPHAEWDCPRGVSVLRYGKRGC